MPEEYEEKSHTSENVQLWPIVAVASKVEGNVP
jgi:hypothetical protein